jgi:hypothetical protein
MIFKINTGAVIKKAWSGKIGRRERGGARKAFSFSPHYYPITSYIIHKPPYFSAPVFILNIISYFRTISLHFLRS